jgi:hypothetical protein
MNPGPDTLGHSSRGTLHDASRPEKYGEITHQGNGSPIVGTRKPGAQGPGWLYRRA